MAAGLPSIVLFAEHGFTEQPDREQLKEQFEFLTGSSYDAYLALGEFDAVPGSREYDNPSKYLFYQDILLGLFDGQAAVLKKSMEDGAAKDGNGSSRGNNLDTYYDLLREKLQDLAGSEAAVEDEILELYIHLADVLSVKAGIGNRLCAAYKAKDMDGLKKIANEEIPSCMEKVRNINAAGKLYGIKKARFMALKCWISELADFWPEWRRRREGCWPMREEGLTVCRSLKRRGFLTVL